MINGGPHIMTDLIISQISVEQNRLNQATTFRQQQWHVGRISAFEESLQMLDATLRSAKTGSPVPLRTTSEIVEDNFRRGLKLSTSEQQKK
jgi:hypothetical protein